MTAKEFYEIHHHIDLGILTKDDCIEMMESYNKKILSSILGHLKDDKLLACLDLLAANNIIDHNLLKKLKIKVNLQKK